MSTSNASDECQAETIVRNGIGGVAVCAGCGHIHLNLQYLTLRFEGPAFSELAALVGRAQRLLSDDGGDAATRTGDMADVSAADSLH